MGPSDDKLLYKGKLEEDCNKPNRNIGIFVSRVRNQVPTMNYLYTTEFRLKLSRFIFSYYVSTIEKTNSIQSVP